MIININIKENQKIINIKGNTNSIAMSWSALLLTFRHVVILCVSIQLGLNKMYIHVGV